MSSVSMACAVDQVGILQGLVRRHLLAHDNNREAAMRAAVAELLDDEATLNVVLREVVWEAVDRYLRRNMTRQRDRAVMAALDISRSAKARAAESIAALLDFPMRSGTKLGAATRAFGRCVTM